MARATEGSGERGRFFGGWDVAALAVVGVALCVRGEAGTPWDGLKLVAVFVLMVALIRRKLGVGLVLLACTPLLGVAFALSADEIFSVMTFGLFRPEAAELHSAAGKAASLGLVVFFVTVLGNLLVDSKVVRGFILALENVVRDVRWIAAMVAAMIGLLPMPGGAMLSAPIVGELSDRLEMDADTKTLANLWFRHVWEMSWFLYPGLIYISTEIEGQTLIGIMVRHAPISAAMILIGVVGILRPIRKVEHVARPVEHKAAAIIWALWPIAVIVVSVALAARFAKQWNSVHVMAASAFVAILAFCLARRLSARTVKATLIRSASLKLAVLIFAVYMMRSMFNASGAANALPGHLAAIGIPAPVTLFCVPMMVGLLTGYVMAAIATVISNVHAQTIVEVNGQPNAKLPPTEITNANANIDPPSTITGQSI